MKNKTTTAALILLAAAPSQGAIVLSGDFVNGTAMIGGTTTPTLSIHRGHRSQRHHERLRNGPGV